MHGMAGTCQTIHYIIHLQVKGVIRHNTEVDCLGHRQYPAKFPYTGLYGYKTIQT